MYLNIFRGYKLLICTAFVVVLIVVKEVVVRHVDISQPDVASANAELLKRLTQMDLKAIERINRSPVRKQSTAIGNGVLNTCPLLQRNIATTTKGERTFLQVYTDVYLPSDLLLNPNDKDCQTTTSERLPLVYKVSCEDLFRSWTKDLESSGDPKFVPPKEIPEGQLEHFLMRNYSRLQINYFSNENWARGSGTSFSKEQIESYMERYKTNNFNSFNYLNDGKAAVYAISEHQPAATGKGVVVGSLSPWLEAALLYYGGSHVTTVEYKQITTSDERLAYLHPKQLAQQWKQHIGLDFVASFSSIEHSGLGRFGDHLDPDGDLKEVQKWRCLLRKGGLFYLGMPNGDDILNWNADRNYGPVRWSMITAGFKLEGIYYANDQGEAKEALNFKQAQGRQATVVLRKVD